MEHDYYLKIKDLPAGEKPRERLLKYGGSHLSNSELLAIILSKGTRNMNVVDMSKHLLSNYNLMELSRENISELRKIKGIGSAKACQIAACFELGRRLGSFREEQKATVTCAEEVYNRLSPKLKSLKQENLVALYLDTRKRILKEEIIFVGTLDVSIVHPREILKSAIKESASAIIISHNHPSGNSAPSDEDIKITGQMIDAAELVGIPLLDHVIIGDENYTSLRSSDELRSRFK